MANLLWYDLLAILSLLRSGGNMRYEEEYNELFYDISLISNASVEGSVLDSLAVKQTVSIDFKPCFHQ